MIRKNSKAAEPGCPELPADGADICRNNVPMETVSAEVFLCATDLFVEYGEEKACEIAALICLGGYESIERARWEAALAKVAGKPEIARAAMDLLSRTHLYFKERFPLCYEPDFPYGNLKWVELIAIAAQGLPSELDTVGRMGCHRLMGLIHTRLKCGTL